jgi:hypothetical protein
MPTNVEYVSEDGVVHATEEEARAHGIVYRTRIARPGRPAEELRPRSRKAVEPEGPAKADKRDWAERLNPRAPMTTDQDLEERAKEQ